LEFHNAFIVAQMGH